MTTLTEARVREIIREEMAAVVASYDARPLDVSFEPVRNVTTTPVTIEVDGFVIHSAEGRRP